LVERPILNLYHIQAAVAKQYEVKESYYNRNLLKILSLNLFIGSFTYKEYAWPAFFGVRRIAGGTRRQVFPERPGCVAQPLQAIPLPYTIRLPVSLGSRIRSDDDTQESKICLR
jgi:hypothetical protein